MSEQQKQREAEAQQQDAAEGSDKQDGDVATADGAQEPASPDATEATTAD
jgi:hypothetical protein